MSSPWPFAQWDLDIVGPFLKVVGNWRWLLVGTDYFTKWVEAEPLSNIRDIDAKKFVWKNIVIRFVIPRTLISDKGFSLIVKPSSNIVVSWALGTYIQPRPICKGMDRLKQSIRSLLMGLRRGWMKQMVDGLKNCHMFFGHIG